MANINRRNEGELASVRARLSAAGATPDLLKMQTEHLESQRSKDIAGLQSGATYATLQEGYQIARGDVASPYATAPGNKGDDDDFAERQAGFAETKAQSFEQYYEALAGAADLGEQETEAEKAQKRAAKAASGGLGSVAGGAGAAGVTAEQMMNPWIADSKKQNSMFLWMQEA
jgi:hypothetical protein